MKGALNLIDSSCTSSSKTHWTMVFRTSAYVASCFLCFLTLGSLADAITRLTTHGPHHTNQLAHMTTGTATANPMHDHHLMGSSHGNATMTARTVDGDGNQGHHHPTVHGAGTNPGHHMGTNPGQGTGTSQGHDMGHMMIMYFHVSEDVPIFFEEWKLDSAGAIVWAVFGLFILAAVYEALKWFREYFRTKTNRKLTDKGCYCPKHSPESKNTTGKAGDVQCCCSSYVRTPLLDHSFQTLLHMAQVFTSYILMLAVMTYNAWLLLAVVLGYGLGYFVSAFHIPRKQLTLQGEKTEQCY